MKKIISALLVVLAVSTTTYAQQDAKAKAILADVSKKYKTYKTLKANFSLSIATANGKVMDTKKGVLTVKTPNKYVINFGGQEIISDGKTNWTYVKSNNEVNVSAVDNSGNALNPAKIFTIYEIGYKYAYSGTGTVNGKAVDQITLSPTDLKKDITKIILSVDKSKQIVKAILYSKNATNTTYTVSGFSPNVAVSDASFAFDAKKYPGVEVNDLR
jgi:chaperone LolA